MSKQLKVVMIFIFKDPNFLYFHEMSDEVYNSLHSKNKNGTPRLYSFY